MTAGGAGGVRAGVRGGGTEVGAVDPVPVNVVGRKTGKACLWACRVGNLEVGWAWPSSVSLTIDCPFPQTSPRTPQFFIAFGAYIV